ncbi:MAG: DUF4093 domain-containing protein [Clostridia bacterium]|nr:DUF4093 domain-containing protein [Clostridia bacterium]
MIKTDEIIIVEGKYDKIALEPLVDATIIATDGFKIFKEPEKIEMLRALAKKRGLVILTDSDRAGFFIRGRLKSLIGEGSIKNAYIPDVAGRERRKREPSKEGKLGVEGMSPEALTAALMRAGVTVSEDGSPKAARAGITKARFYADGFSGGEGSHAARAALARSLGLPERISANALLEVINALYTPEEYEEFIKSL